MNDDGSVNVSSKIRFIGRVLLFIFGCAFALAAAVPFVPKLSGMWTEVCLGTITSLVTFGLTVLFVRWDGVQLEDVGASPNRRSPWRLIYGFLIGLFLVAVWALLSAAVGYVRWVRGADIGLTEICPALLAYLALSCREELSFRGYPLRRLEHPLGMWGAQIFIATLFALEHVVGGATWANAFLGAGVGALLFGMAAIATRGLAIPIGMHAAWNFGQWTLGLKGQVAVWQGAVAVGQEEAAEVAGMTAYVVVSLVATLLFWL